MHGLLDSKVQSDAQIALLLNARKANNYLGLHQTSYELHRRHALLHPNSIPHKGEMRDDQAYASGQLHIPVEWGTPLCQTLGIKGVHSVAQPLISSRRDKYPRYAYTHEEQSVLDHR